jgi:hypothetical protein
MPPFGALLTAQQCADIAAWLMGQKDVVEGTKKDKKDKKKDDTGKDKASDALAISRKPLSAEEKADRLVLMQGTEKVGEFVFADAMVKRPYFSNMHAPGGIQVTRNFPPVEGVDPTDHADMHPGIWLGFGDINGTDFWRNGGTIRHDKIMAAPEVLKGDETLKFATNSTLLAKDGAALAHMDSQFSLNSKGGVLKLIWIATFHATEGDLVFGDQEEMGFGVRVATSITEKNGGVITNSKGVTGAKNTWGQPAEWCDYSGTINGHAAGITIVPDPANPQPCWWHNRDYGVFVANSFGRKAMKQGDKQSTTVKQGSTLRLGFTALLHSGEYTLPAK